jgi:glycosyltransferase involved in cell wall biosynthesis
MVDISVVVPVWNGARFLHDAIESIDGGSRRAVEVVIVDDASTDATPAVARALCDAAPNRHYLRLDRNVGPGRARNAGLAVTHGELIGFLDADDRYPDGALDVLHARLTADSATDLAMGRIRVMRSTDPGEAPRSFSAEGPAIRCFQLGSVLARRHSIDLTACFDPAYRYGEDIDWFMRLQEANAVFDLCDDVVLLHRRHARNMTDHDDNGLVDMALVMRASLARRKRLAEQRGVALTDIYYVRPDTMRVAEI